MVTNIFISGLVQSDFIETNKLGYMSEILRDSFVISWQAPNRYTKGVGGRHETDQTAKKKKS